MNKTYRKGAIDAMKVLAIVILIWPGYLLAQTPDIEAKIKSVPPVTYPAEASKTGLEGQIRVVVDIDVRGKVSKTYEPTGPGWVCPDVTRDDVVAMRRISQRAADRAVFVPAMKDRKPVASQMVLTFDFKNLSPKKPTEGGLSIGARVAPNGEPTNDPEKSTATAERKTLPGGVLNGKAKALPKPVYPEAARAVKASGAVKVLVLIDTNGFIFSAEPQTGHPLLRYSARVAACSSRFSPTLLSGEPVNVSGYITYNFVGR